MKEIINIVREVLLEISYTSYVQHGARVPIPELKGWSVIESKSDSGIPWWDIFDADGAYTGNLIKRKGVYRLTFTNSDGQQEKVDQDFGTNYVQAARYIFLQLQKPISENATVPFVPFNKNIFKRKIKFQDIDGYSISFIDDGRKLKSHTIKDKVGRIVGIVDNSGILSYIEPFPTGQKWINVPKSEYGGNVKNAVRYVFLKRQKPLR